MTLELSAEISKESKILSKMKKMFSRKKKLLLTIMIMVFIGGVNVLFAETKSLEKSRNKKREQTIEKLNKIIIDRIDFEDDNIDVAVKMLSKKSGMDIIYKRLPKDKHTQHLVDLVLVKRTLMEAIYYVCKATKLNYHIGENVVVISSAPNPLERKEEIDKRKKKIALTKKKLQNISLANIKFTNADIYSVAKEISKLSKAHDPDKVGISIEVGLERCCVQKFPIEYPKITMNFKKKSIDEILKYLHNRYAIKNIIGDGVVTLFVKEKEY